MRRFWLLAAFFLLVPSSVAPKHAEGQAPPDQGCEHRNPRVPYFYVEATREMIEPPEWRHSSIRIGVDMNTKVDLWTNGGKFKLWSATVTLQDVEKFLVDLDRSCRLPEDPKDAAALFGAKWESLDLSASQFAGIHERLTAALSQYVSSAQKRYDGLTRIIYVDGYYFPVIYDNSYEHMEFQVWNDPDGDRSMLEWLDEVETLAEANFHHPFPHPSRK